MPQVRDFETLEIASFARWIGDIRDILKITDPEFVGTFDQFANEALFGRRWLQATLNDLPRGSAVLEVGAGVALLSCQLAREGYKVTIIEPISDGFSSFSRILEIVLQQANAQSLNLTVLRIEAECLDTAQRFDAAFSINVMEHVGDFAKVIENVLRNLKPGGIYRFTCPNYLFPYEPHFNIPTLFSKDLTERVLGRWIRTSSRVSEPENIWRSLNWIDVRRVRSVVARFPDARVTFDTGMIADTFERTASDETFASRRSGWMVTILGWVVALRMQRLFSRLPASALPIMDCVIRIDRKEAH